MVGSNPAPALRFLRNNMFLQFNTVGSLRDREVASWADRQGSNFESCVWRAVSSHSSHHPQEVLLTQLNSLKSNPSVILLRMSFR